MAWRGQATGLCLSQCWQSSMAPVASLVHNELNWLIHSYIILAIVFSSKCFLLCQNTMLTANPVKGNKISMLINHIDKKEHQYNYARFSCAFTCEAERDRYLNYHDVCLHFRCWRNHTQNVLVLYYDVVFSYGKEFCLEVLINIYLLASWYVARQTTSNC